MDEGDSTANFPNHLTFSYADFLTKNPVESLVKEDGKTVDLQEIEKFLLETKPRSWRDAYPLYVVAKHALKVHHSGDIRKSSSQLAKLTADLKAAEAARDEAVARADLYEQKYNTLAKNTKSSYLGLTADFDRRQAVRLFILQHAWLSVWNV